MRAASTITFRYGSQNATITVHWTRINVCLCLLEDDSTQWNTRPGRIRDWNIVKRHQQFLRVSDLSLCVCFCLFFLLFYNSVFDVSVFFGFSYGGNRGEWSSCLILGLEVVTSLKVPTVPSLTTFCQDMKTFLDRLPSSPIENNRAMMFVSR